MELEMKGDVAIVTGSASGIGWACAQSLAREGCSVALWDLSSQVEEKAAALTHQFGCPSLCSERISLRVRSRLPPG